MSARLSAAAFDAAPLPPERWPAPRLRPTGAELAGSPDLTAAEQWRLAKHSRAEIRFALAANPSIAPEVQLHLAADRVAATALAANPSICDATQAALLHLRSPLITTTVVTQALLGPRLLRTLLAGPTYLPDLARNARLPEAVYRHLVRQSDQAVRMPLGSNPAVAAEVLAVLATDPREPVRSAVASNSSLPRELQRLLARDPALAVRRSLAGNRRLGPDVQMVLARDSGTSVEVASNHTIDTAVVDQLLLSAPTVGFGLAGHPGLDLRQQMALLSVGGYAVRSRLAINPCLHPGLQLQLCEDPDGDVCRQLARNTALAGEAQVRLAGRPEQGIRSGLFGNPSLGRSALRVLLDSLVAGERLWLAAAIQEGPMAGSGSRHKRTHLDHPVRGPMVALLSGRSSLLDAAARHSDPLVRWALLCNERIGIERLGHLLNDDEEVIRQAAQAQFIAALAA